MKERTEILIRNYCAQLAASAQGASGKNVKIQKPQSETNNGEEEVLKNQEETPRRRVRKPSKSLTAVLSARSKVACGITSKPKEPVLNIDESDINNELAEVEYVEDIYKY
ncbi:putative cyclin [Helianthus anomalus]